MLALVWFVLAGFLYSRGQNGGGALPLSAAAVILGVFNLIRWWWVRAAGSHKGQGEEMLPRRRLRRASDDMPAPDPNFNFTDAPPPQIQAPAPPGTNGTGPENRGTGFSS